MEARSMKSRILLLLPLVALALVATTQAFAQEEYLELLRQDIQTEKVAILTEAMMLDAGQSEVFWPLYREYNGELQKITDQSIALIKDYAASYESMDDATAAGLGKKMLQLEGDRTKLKQKTFQKMEKEMGAVMATRWLQVENQLLNMLMIQVQSEIPLIEHTAPKSED
jgi:hypothetical protein